MARSDLSNVSSDLSSTENILDSTDDASFPDTDEVCSLLALYSTVDINNKPFISIINHSYPQYFISMINHS